MLPADTSAPAVARHRTVGYLADLGLVDFAADVSLIVSELVTNAVLHGAPPVELTLVHAPPLVRVEVCDRARDLGVVAPHPRAAGRARGLHIVDELSSQWGSNATAQGKVVWAEYPTR